MNKKDLKVEYKTERIQIGDTYTQNRHCFWRIQPSELPWWKRPFNRWKPIHVYLKTFTELSTICNPWEFSEVKNNCKTVEDIENREQKLRNLLYEDIGRKEAAWEDED